MARLRGVLVTTVWVQLVLILSLQASAVDKAAPLVIGDTFTIDSKILGETRRINVYMPRL